jgi:hypothetical protein
MLGSLEDKTVIFVDGLNSKRGNQRKCLPKVDASWMTAENHVGDYGEL